MTQFLVRVILAVGTAVVEVLIQHRPNVKLQASQEKWMYLYLTD